MYPHVIVSLEPGDAVVFWKDVVYSGVAYKEDCNYQMFHQCPTRMLGVV
jgi:hypothetical protein